MSKESMARIKSPEWRKAHPWTLERRDEFLRKQTNEDVERKRERFSQINQEREEAAEALAAYESQLTEKQNEDQRIDNKTSTSATRSTKGHHFCVEGFDEPAF